MSNFIVRHLARRFIDALLAIWLYPQRRRRR